MFIKICPQCNNEFTAQSKNRKFLCSVECSREYAKTKAALIDRSAICLECNVVFQKAKWQSEQKFCCRSCSATYNNKRKPKKPINQKKRTINHIASEADDRVFCKHCNSKIHWSKLFCNQICNNEYKKKIKRDNVINGLDRGGPHIWKEILTSLRGHACEDCGTSTWKYKSTEWNDKPIPLELDHIDGNHQHETLDNLRLICPTCHAMTPTYKARNKGNGRSHRVARYHQDKATKDHP